MALVNRTTLFTGGVIVVSLAAAAVIGSRPKETDASPAEVRAPVGVANVTRRTLPGQVRAGGFLRATDEITVSAERAGRVTALPAAEGARVVAGAEVARLDDAIAAANLERARTMAQEAALDPNVPAAEQARMREAVRTAAHEVALRHPKTTIAGVVERHHVEVGEHVMVGQPLVDIVDDSSLVLDVDVDAEVVGRLEVGGPVEIAAAAAGGTFAGSIARIATRATPRTRRFRIEVAVKTSPGLRAGMHAEARFPMPPGEPSLYVAKAAVRDARGERGVFVVEDGVARWRTVYVEEIYHRPDLWRIVGGDIDDGAVLVVRGFSGLRSGAAVEIER